MLIINSRDILEICYENFHEIYEVKFHGKINRMYFSAIGKR